MAKFHRRQLVGPWNFLVPLAGLTMILSGLVSPSAIVAQEPEAFTEPFQTVELAAAETGIISQLAVQQGDSVARGQVIANLENSIVILSLQIAEAARNATGERKAAEAELRLQNDRLKRLEELQKDGNATAEEVREARSLSESSLGQLLAIQERLQIRSLELERFRAQSERRLIRSSIDGIVTEINHRPGELVSPNDPVVATIVQLDPLIAVFSIPADQIGAYAADQSVRLKFADQNTEGQGSIRFISPVTEPESQTVLVKVVIPNAKRKIRSGTRVTLLGTIPDSPPSRINNP